ncbi:hypothetical protein [Bacillus taeanensis]|uniref:Uncharacterized protein n=1 Tax=Bacillus taeanensis TaxID=273032 RepID=A0A366Y0P4_9BACI|nr:hypothetical protein [Bacillus taeanensis]RBW69973.1 hypothetical protein DS031_08955 [Bacillus taeanensis]
MKKWIVNNKILLLISLAAVLLLGLAFNQFQRGHVPKEVKEQAAKLSTNTSTKENAHGYSVGEVKGKISVIHDYLNTKLCWGRYQAFDKGSKNWGEIEPTVNRFIENLDEMIAATEGNEKLQADLMVARQAFTYALENEDKITLVYLHRIFHDLDGEINDETLDKFGYASYANGDISRVWNHITIKE